MTTYAREVRGYIWHWCNNCTKYPTNIGTTTTVRPSWDLCDECKAKEKNGDCGLGFDD